QIGTGVLSYVIHGSNNRTHVFFTVDNGDGTFNAYHLTIASNDSVGSTSAALMNQPFGAFAIQTPPGSPVAALGFPTETGGKLYLPFNDNNKGLDLAIGDSEDNPTWTNHVISDDSDGLAGGRAYIWSAIAAADSQLVAVWETYAAALT